MILTKTNILYVAIAVVFGLVVAFGYSGMSYHPLPLQVKEDLYMPAPAPTAAIPTVAPQPIKGSNADKPADPTDKFAPAQAPVVVTTAPLPTITPEEMAVKNDCCANSPFNQTTSTLAGNIGAAFNFVCVITGIVGIVYGLINVMGPMGDGGYTSVMISGVMAIMVGGIMMVIMSVIVNSMTSAIVCIC